MSTQNKTILAASDLPLTPEQREALGKLVLTLEEFRKVEPDIPVQQVITFLTVALHPGSTVTALASLAGTTLSSASRHVENLGPYRPVKKKGKGLLVDDYDANDRRLKGIKLTPGGVRIVKSLLHYLTN